MNEFFRRVEEVGRRQTRPRVIYANALAYGGRVTGNPYATAAGVALQAPELSILLTGEDHVTPRLERMTEKFPAEVVKVSRTYGLQLQNDVRARAIRMFNVTNYDRSIRMSMVQIGDRIAVNVGSNEPQTNRLEFGFVGRDSLGRFVEQPPRPHFRPAMDRIRPLYRDAVNKALNDTARREFE